MTVSVVVATYGNQEWKVMAANRAVPSAWRENPDEVIVYHGDGTLAQARNHAANHTDHDWLLFLDGDDELAPGYLTAMRAATDRHPLDEPRLYVPQVQYIRGRQVNRPQFPPEVNHRDGNWLVIGTVIPAWLFRKVGGFEEWPIYEDWALFARMQDAGAVPVKVPDAVYVAHQRPGSRNRSSPPGERAYWHQRIGHSLWPDLYDQTTPEEDDRQLLLTAGRIRKTTRRLVAS